MNCWIFMRTVSFPVFCLLSVLSHFSRAQLFATLWTVACQAPLSMQFSRQEYWSGLPCPSPGNPLNPGIEPGSFKILYCLSHQGIPRYIAETVLNKVNFHEMLSTGPATKRGGLNQKSIVIRGEK